MTSWFLVDRARPLGQIALIPQVRWIHVNQMGTIKARLTSGRKITKAKRETQGLFLPVAPVAS